MDHEKSGAPASPSRRKFVTKVAYIAPAILSLSVTPSYASTGSGSPSSPPEDHQYPPWLLRLLKLFGWS